MNFNRRHLVIVLAMVAILIIVGTAVFVYFPIQINIQGTGILVDYGA